MVDDGDKLTRRHTASALPKPPKLTLQDLHRMVATFPATLNEGGRALALCGAVIRHFFGIEWTRKHMMPPGAPASAYLRLTEGPVSAENVARMLRVIDFAEALYNLREVPGLEACLQQLSDGMIESGCAELDVARMLFVHKIPFRFVIPQKLRRGEDYDYIIVYPDGLEVAADAKCTLESRPFNPKTILNALHDGRNQLPKEGGIFFVKVPPPWIQKVDMANAVVATADQFFARGTRRVVSVKFYAQPIIYTDEITAGIHIYSEVTNPNAIIPNRNWDLFKGTREIRLNDPNFRGMPDWWVKFMYFPTGIPRGTKDDSKT